jgi:hypothetical protein
MRFVTCVTVSEVVIFEVRVCMEFLMMLQIIANGRDAVSLEFLALIGRFLMFYAEHNNIYSDFTVTL